MRVFALSRKRMGFFIRKSLVSIPSSEIRIKRVYVKNYEKSVDKRGWKVLLDTGYEIK